MHPELFELKALVAGRLDAHRRREIDDHLGSCADCSRHYVAMMLGSASPKTAEAEARQALVPNGVGSALAAGVDAPSLSYGIDAPIAPSAPRPAARVPHNNLAALETEIATGPARTQVPVSASLVDAIAKLRAEADAPKPEPTVAPPRPAATLAPEIVAPSPAESSLIEPSIFLPTPPDGVSIVPRTVTPVATAPAPELPAFMTRPPSASPDRNVAQPELVVTFSSTPSRLTSYRTPATVGALGGGTEFEYVSQSVPVASTAPLTEFSIAETTVARKPKPMLMAGALAGAALVVILGISGYNYFKSSVSQAAAAAASAAAKQVEAAAARNVAAPSPVASAPAPEAQVQTRIVYVREPARRGAEPTRGAADAPSAAPSSSAPVTVSLPEVNLSTGAAENALQANTQRSATSELTRSARATATRTAAPRPY